MIRRRAGRPLSMLLFAALVLGGTRVGFAQEWHILPTPDPSPTFNITRSIDGAAPGEIWAVGTFELDGAAIFRNLILRWDGAAWSNVAAPSPATLVNDLYAVEAVAPGNAYAVGIKSYGNRADAQMLHWNGSLWSEVTLPELYPGAVYPGSSTLWGIHANAPNDIWAVGSMARLGLALHWDGAKWQKVDVPFVTSRHRLSAVAGTAADHVWAVGDIGDRAGDYTPWAIRWDGSTWTTIPIPFGHHVTTLEDVAVIGPNDVWAVGDQITGGCLTIHWDGSSWTPFENPGCGALAVLGTSDIYAVGGVITHWDGRSWEVVDPLAELPSPSLGSTAVLPDGSIWTAGRTIDGDVFRTLTLRRQSEQVQAQTIEPFLDCVLDNNDGTFAAIFGYRNQTGSTVDIAAGLNNRLDPAPARRGQPTRFRRGGQNTALGVVFDGTPLTWSVSYGGRTASATASATSRRCAANPLKPIAPLLQCVTSNADGTFNADFGYTNPNAFTVYIPVGAHNAFSPGAQSRKQPVIFRKGTRSAALIVTWKGSPLTWTLSGNSVKASGSSTACVVVNPSAPTSSIAEGPIEQEQEWEETAYYVEETDEIATGTSGSEEIPRQYALEQNYPNPFTRTTHITFSLPTPAEARLALYDVTGRIVSVLSEGWYEAGQHTVLLEAAEMPAGSYVYRLETSHGSFSKSLTIMK